MKLDQLAKLLAADVASVIKKHLGEQNQTFTQKIAEIESAFEKRFAALPAPEKGEKGDPGEVDMDAVKAMINKAVSAIELPKGEKGEAGEPGKDAIVDEEKLFQMIAEQFKNVELPLPEKGEKGDPGEIDVNLIKQMVTEEVEAHQPVTVSLSNEEIEDGINERRSYPRGTLARHSGGLWRAYERTSGMKGWECIIAGVSDIDISYDGERTVTISVSKSDGSIDKKEIIMPVMIDKGVYRESEEYLKGDTVTLSGAIWTAQKDSPKGRPGVSPDWRLSVKRGGTGKSAFDLARDAGFEGTRQEWLYGLGKKPTVKIEP